MKGNTIRFILYTLPSVPSLSSSRPSVVKGVGIWNRGDDNSITDNRFDTKSLDHKKMEAAMNKCFLSNCKRNSGPLILSQNVGHLFKLIARHFFLCPPNRKE